MPCWGCIVKWGMLEIWRNGHHSCDDYLLSVYFDFSPKLAACAADLSSPYPDSALGFEAVCHLIVSALAYWPVFGWTPGLFHSLLTNVEVTSLMAMGPKETCSLLCLLVSIFSSYPFNLLFPFLFWLVMVIGVSSLESCLNGNQLLHLLL